MPLVDTGILKDKRVMLVRDLDVDCVLAGLKPFLYYSQVDTIEAETNRGSKTGKLIDTLQRLSVRKYDLFNAFLRIIGGTQPDLFYKLVGREPSEEEADFCVEAYAQNLRECIRTKGHCTDSLLDETIRLDSEHVQLAIVRDKPDPDTYDDLPHRYQTHLSKVQDGKGMVSAVDVLSGVESEEKPKRVSVYGLAGTGKSTTFQWLATEWGSSRWGSQFTVIFLLQMRMAVCV